MIKVSIIVPVYNAEKYLYKCFDSLVNQTLQEIEILAVNDGSTDNSSAILKEYARNYPGKVRVFHKENGGQASARNLALRNAVGEYVGFVDADDYADVQMFELLYRKAIQSRADLTVCDHYMVENEKAEYIRFPEYEKPRAMLKGVLVSPWNKLLKREVLQNSGVIFPEGYIYEDTAWFAELIPFIRSMAYVRKPLLYHIVQENSTMTAAQGKRTAQIFPVMNGVIDFYKEKGLYEEYREELEYFYIRILLLSSLQRISQIKNKQLRNQYTKRTLDEIRNRFPGYKGNRYLKGWRGVYIKSTNSLTIRLAVTCYRIGCRLGGK